MAAICAGVSWTEDVSDGDEERLLSDFSSSFIISFSSSVVGCNDVSSGIDSTLMSACGCFGRDDKFDFGIVLSLVAVVWLRPLGDKRRSRCFADLLFALPPIEDLFRGSIECIGLKLDDISLIF